MTAGAAAEVLRDGGNAFDAVIAAQLAACVAEPVFASLGGGGYALVHAAGAAAEVYDFFSQTPRDGPRPGAEDFHPVHADFGPTTQEFHIGLGSVAVPGMVAGMFRVHADLGSLSFERLARPAVRAAREGHVLSPFQAYLFEVVGAIYTHSESARDVYTAGGLLPGAGARLVQTHLGDILEALAREGPDLFYRGELARRIAATCRDGGNLTTTDLEHYRVIRARPLSVRYRRTLLHTNPAPASGGTLVAFALQLLETEARLPDFASPAHVELLAAVMALTQRGRLAHGLESLLDPELVANYRAALAERPACLSGTTHISVVDAAGNLASMTLSNGEGCGHVVPGTGIMLNNMLGEADINPEGFQRWRPDTRMTSMMAPSLLEFDGGRRVVLGSGGSNRIRTALLQVISNLVDFDVGIAEAVSRPRAHFEDSILSLEPGLSDPISVEHLSVARWQAPNLFFGGVHCVEHRGARFEAAPDPRREGYALVVTDD